MCRRYVCKMSVLTVSFAVLAGPTLLAKTIVPAVDSCRALMSKPNQNDASNRLVVRTELGDPTRSYKSWIKFDVNHVDVNNVTSATLVFALWKDRGNCELDVSYVNDDVVENINWTTTDLTWNNAPGNDPSSEGKLDPSKTTFLARVGLLGGVAGDKFTVDVLQALKADTDGILQFVLHNASAYLQIAHHADPCEAWRPVLVLTERPKAALIVKAKDLVAGFDQAQKERLEALGYQVVLVTGTDVKNDVFTMADAAGYDLLVVSESIGSGDINKLIGVKVPMMHQESYGWSRHFFTTGQKKAWTTPAGGILDVINDSHPIILGAGLGAGPVAFFKDPNVALTTDLVSSLVPGAVNLVQTTDADGAVVTCIFAIEAGTTLANGLPAASRIVGFSLPGNNSYKADVMTEQAWALFDAAVRWLNPARPIARWPLDEPTGAAVVDVVGSNKGAMVGLDPSTARIADGALGGGVRFDNIDGHHIEVPYCDTLDLGYRDFSISMFVRYAKAPVDVDQWVMKGNRAVTGTGSWYGLVHTGGASVRFTAEEGPAGIKSVLEVPDTAFVTGDWVHVVAVRDAVNDLILLYANGVLQGVQADTSGDISNGKPLWIGESTDEPGTAMSGDIDEVQFFDQALTRGQIVGMYK